MNAMIAPVDLKKAYRLINHGPTVLVSAAHAGVENVMAAAWVAPLDYENPKLTVVLDKNTRTRELVDASAVFGIQIPNVAQRHVTEAVGSVSLRDDPEKLTKAGVELFRFPECDVPFVKGCSAWLACRVLNEPLMQQRYDLFLAEVVAAWSDTRVFRDGHWHFEDAGPEWRSLHHVAGGHFYCIGDAVHPDSKS